MRHLARLLLRLNVFNVKRTRCAAIAGSRRAFAERTGKRRIAVFIRTQLQDGWLSGFEAVCTHVMCRLAIAHRFFQGVDRSAPKGRGHFVALLLSIPCFHLHNLFFKIALIVTQRRILLLYGREHGIELNDGLLELYQHGIALRGVGSLRHLTIRLNNLSKRR